MRREELEREIKILEEQGYRKISGEVDDEIATPLGIYNFFDLITGACPICEGYFRDNLHIRKTICLHNEALLEDVKKARTLAGLLQENICFEMEDMGIIFETAPEAAHEA